MIYSKDEAIKYAADLRSQGYTAVRIADALRNRGFANPRTGNPYTAGVVNYMLRDAGYGVYGKNKSKAINTPEASVGEDVDANLRVKLAIEMLRG